MSGLRARQKADRHRRIIEAAAALFREAGYEGAKIEAIAAQAEVSIGTIYNYYENKGDILGAIVSLEVNEVLNAGRGVVARPPANVGDALDTLWDGKVWREFPAPRLATPHTHGTGCTYSAAITAHLALGFALEEAVDGAKRFVHRAIRSNPGLGGGSGPVNHWAE